jgi:hypothetical protein
VDADPVYNARSYIEERTSPEPPHMSALRTERGTRDKSIVTKKIHTVKETTIDSEQRPLDADPANDRSRIEERPSSEPSPYDRATYRSKNEKQQAKKPPSKGTTQSRSTKQLATSTSVTAKYPTHCLPAPKSYWH